MLFIFDLEKFIKSTFDGISSYQIIDFVFTQEFLNILFYFGFLYFIIATMYYKIKGKSLKKALFEAILDLIFKILIYIIFIFFLINIAQSIKVL